MNKNILIVFGGALLVALLVALAVSMTLGGKKQVVAEPAKVEILVAARDLATGHELVPEDVKWQSWPKSTVFPGAVMREGETPAAEALKGRLARPVSSGEPLLKSALLGEAKGNIIAATLHPGMRAMAIDVTPAGMVGGFMGPGDYVDVVLTYRESFQTDDADPRVKDMLELNLNNMATETIIQNIRVLAVDQSAQAPEDDKFKVGKTVTVEVSPQNAEKLSLAQQMGELTLVLRSVGDENPVARDWPVVSDARMTNMTDEIFTEYQKLKRNETGFRRQVMRIYSGDTVDEVIAP